ncbi:MAG: efflux transporter outer membrane subunit [Planctomycetota bacterium]|nr:efflux transporter outer membrane subunit [Planctomycetota bacterium]
MRAHVLGCCGVLALVSGCAIGPDPDQRPIPEVPARFVEVEAAPDAAGAQAPSIARLAAGDATLAALLGAGLAKNDDLRIAVARVAEARALLGAAEADLFPTIESFAEAERRRQSGNADERGGDGVTENRFSVGVQSSWELDLWGRLRSAAAAATFDARAAEASLHDVRRSLAAEIAAEYIRVRGLRAQLGIAQRGVVNQERLATITDALAREGAGTIADVRRVDARLERTRAAIPPLEAAVRVSVHRLSVLCVLAPAEVASLLEASPDAISVPESLAAGVPSDLLRARPDILASEFELAAATARVGVATADLFPRVTLLGDFGVASGEIGKLFSGDSIAFGVGPSVRWPILNFGRVRAQVRAQGARQQAALAAYEQVVRRAVAEVESALAEHRGALGERARLELAIASAIEAQRLAQLRYSAGADPLIAVLDAERERLEIEQQLEDSRTRVLTAYVAISRALASPVAGPRVAQMAP